MSAAPAADPAFRDAEHARAWLVERLDRLEEAVRDASDLQHTASSMAADAMAQLEAEPLAFRKTAVIHLRDLDAALTLAASARTGREGFNVAALERMILRTLGASPAHGREVLEGLVAGLRDRVDDLALRGNGALDESQQQLDDALASLDQALQRVVRRWEAEPLGVWNRWRRRRRMQRQGLEQLAGLPDLALGLAEAAREHRAAFEEVWATAARGAIALGAARSYSDVLDWLSSALAGVGIVARHAADVARDAAHRLARHAGEWRDGGVPDQRNLLTERLLDRILDHRGLHTAGFLGRSEVRAAELGRLGRQGLEAELKRWIEGEVVRLAEPALADVLGGYARDADVIGPLVELLTAGQPLARFNDDLHRLWPEGLPAQYQLLVTATDGSLDDALADACIQVGLPGPQIEVTPRPDGRLELRLLQLVSGLAWFSEADRLAPMIAVHAEVMAEADAHLETREGLRAALRDDRASETLPPLLPDQVVRGMTEVQRLRREARRADAADGDEG